MELVRELSFDQPETKRGQDEAIAITVAATTEEADGCYDPNSVEVIADVSDVPTRAGARALLVEEVLGLGATGKADAD